MASEHAAGSARDQPAALDVVGVAQAEVVRMPGWRVSRTVGLGTSAALLVLIALGLSRYPLNPWVLAGALAAYGALLWYRPVVFLLCLPIVLPAWDLGIWTGWMMTGEADFFVLMTVAVLLARDPPVLADFVPAGLAGAVLLAFCGSWIIAVVAGLASPLGAPQSDNAFLRPDNALRIGKGLVEALILLPFLRKRERIHGDAVAWFGYGMAAGIGAVTAIVLTERALFPGILDFSAEYRVAGPFSSMRVGGGHIGAWVVLALPFAVCVLRIRPRWLATMLLLATCACGGYTLAVTFARTAYAAGLIAMVVTGAVWLGASRRLTNVSLVPVVLVVAALVAAALSGGMRERFASSGKDFLTRRGNWEAGLAVRDTGALTDVFGMGLGTYQRAMLMRSAVDRPSDIVVGTDGNGAYVSMRVESPFFLGQKITPPATGDLHLTLLARTPEAGTTLGILVCDKVLLYSDQCRGGSAALGAPGVWRPVTLALPTNGVGSGFGMLRRPVELSLFGGPDRHRVDIRDVQLTDDTGHSLVANGDFTHGLDRWIFTDDSHVSWRMLNEYLMLWFETGALGLAAFLALSGLAFAGGCAGARRGSVAGAAVAGSVAAFLISGLFDNVLEAPRVATVFFLVCLCGLMQWEGGSRSPRTVEAAGSKV